MTHIKVQRTKNTHVTTAVVKNRLTTYGARDQNVMLIIGLLTLSLLLSLWKTCRRPRRLPYLTCDFADLMEIFSNLIELFSDLIQLFTDLIELYSDLIELFTDLIKLYSDLIEL